MPCAADMAPSAPNRQLVTCLRRLDVAGDDGGRIVRLQHRAFGDDDVDRPQAAGVHRDVVVDHDAEHVEHGGARHRLGRVEVGRLLRRGAGEIDGRLALLLVDRDLDLDHGALVGISVARTRSRAARR